MQLSSGTLNKNAKREYSAYPKKSKVNIKDRKNGHFCSHYCSHCCKAFCEFETKKNGIALNLVF